MGSFVERRWSERIRRCSIGKNLPRIAIESSAEPIKRLIFYERIEHTYDIKTTCEH